MEAIKKIFKMKEYINTCDETTSFNDKIEELDSKISDRGLVQQIGFNPFLGETNYVNDIGIRDQFLKPINTTQGSTKASQSEHN